MPTPKTLNLKAAPWKIASLAGLKRDGRLHLPDLQRGFVWTADRVRALHDSLYRSYPVGALLLWQPKWEGEPPFSTRAWDICPPDEVTARGAPEPPQPVVPGSLFVLDGQQRLTSIFRLVFRSRIRAKTTPDPDLLVALSPGEEWLTASDELFFEALDRANAIRTFFFFKEKTAYEIDADAGDDNVIEIFARL